MLQKQLDAMIDKIESGVPKQMLDIMHGATKELSLSNLTEKALKVSDIAPVFSLPNALGREVNLGALLQKGPVVLTFYRGSWCPYCNLELRALQQALGDMEKYNATLVAVSPQTPDNTLSHKEKAELTFEVLSDAGNQVAKDFGLVFQLPANLQALYNNTFGIDLNMFNGDNSHELPVPATYVIGMDGKISYSYINVDYRKRAEPAEIINVLKSH